MYASKEKGVSVIVCCYNSALRIGKTLRGLAAQRLDKADQLEVILVDNGCTDYTSLVAAKEWESCHSIFPLHIHKELKKGLTSARQKGIDAAIYDNLLFCDDDNWLSSDYVDNAFACLNKDIKIGACGGLGVAVFENEAPGWFGLYAEAFATGPQHVRSAAGTLISLYGAGLAVKKQALIHLNQSGFKPVLSGRLGNSLSSGEDTELTNALVLAGYRLEYCPQMVFRHYMPASRMNRTYLHKLFKSFGQDAPVRNVYNSYLQPESFQRWMGNWWLHLFTAILRTVKYLVMPPKKSGRTIYLIWSIAYLKMLFKLKPSYSLLKKNIDILKH